jgi:UDP-N-acetylmuramate dehydrogenase
VSGSLRDTRHEVATRLIRAGLAPRVDQLMSRTGYWRIGGPADIYVDVSDMHQLSVVLGQDVPCTVVGNGSNLLVADAGIRGITVRLIGELRATQVEEGAGATCVRVGAGILNQVLLRRLDEQGMYGLAALAGVPGSVGGAIRMNAGTSLGEIGERVVEVDVLLPGGHPRRLTAAELNFSYRHCAVPNGAIVVSALLRVDRNAAGLEAARAQTAAHLERRRATQPLDQPSCGSVFRNPPGDAAGRLIEASGLKGHRRGGAQISERHANFIVNEGGATAADVYDLVLLARNRVHAATGIVLEPEVHAVGEWPAGSWPLPPP